MIVGPQGPVGGGISLMYTAERLTNTSAPAQAKNWLAPWGLTVFPATLIPASGVKIYPPNSGTIRKLRCSRLLTAGNITFAIEVNGTQQMSILLAGGAGPASAQDLVTTYAFTQSGSDYLTVSITAATPDTTTNVFPQITFLLD